MATIPAPEIVETLCPKCGGNLNYQPGTEILECESCGIENVIDNRGEAVTELALRDYLRTVTTDNPTIKVNAVKCSGCGAQTTFPVNVTAGTCAFCGNNLVFASATTQTIIKPKAMLPFKIEKAVALTSFDVWVRNLWFAPDELKGGAAQDGRLSGVYLPFWTYDAQTTVTYIGERGKDYEVYKDGSKTEKETRIEWTDVTGTIYRNFDDVLIAGSRSLPQVYQDALEPWNLEGLKPYDDRYISGFKAESYQLDVRQAWEIAKEKMDPIIRDCITEDIGGDHQRITSLNVTYGRLSFKHILLPIWISSYLHRDKVYHFMVNGITGEVMGERPYSGLKIMGAILAVLLIVLMIYLFSQVL